MGALLTVLFILGVAVVVVVAFLLRTGSPDERNDDSHYQDTGNRPDFR